MCSANPHHPYLGIYILIQVKCFSQTPSSYAASPFLMPIYPGSTSARVFVFWNSFFSSSGLCRQKFCSLNGSPARESFFR